MAVAVGWPRRRKGEEGAHVTFSDSHRSNCGGIIAVSLARSLARSDGQTDADGRARIASCSQEQREHFTVVVVVAAAFAPSSSLIPAALSLSRAG